MNFKSLFFLGFTMFLLSVNQLFAQINVAERPNPNSDLQLIKTVDKSTVRVGAIVNFTLKVKNLGPGATRGATVFDLLPNGYTFISSSNPAAYNTITGEWDVDDLSAGAEETLVITALVNPITPTSVYTNVAQIIDNKNIDNNTNNDRSECIVVVYDHFANGTTICANNSASLSASSTNVVDPIYKWYADAQLANLVHIGANFNTPALQATTTYYLVVTGVNIPAQTAADAKLVEVKVLGVPLSPVVVVSQPTCEVSTGSITVTSPIAAGNTYSIDGSTYLNNGGVFTGVAPGTYSVSVKNVSGCISASSLVVVNSQPTLPAAPSLSIIQPTCELSTGTISISSPLNIGNTYSINGVDYGNTSGVFTGVAPGTYNVSVRNVAGCIGSGTVAVVNANPLTPSTPVVEVLSPVCPAKTGSIRISSPLGAGYSYSIDGSTYVNTTGVFTSVVPGSYNVSVKNASGCVSSKVLVVVKDPVVDEVKLEITSTGSTSICSGSSVVLVSSEATSYQWYKNGISISGATGKTFTASTEGVYTVSRLSTSGCTSVQSDGIEVKVLGVPLSPVVVVSQPTCEVSTGSITVTSPIAAGNTYSIDGSTYLNNGGVFTGVAPGTYVLSVKNVNGCISSGTSVTVNSFPLTPSTPLIEVVNPICPDKNGSIKVLSPIGDSFKYSIDGATYFANSGFFNAVPPGTYNVTVRNSSGCTSIPVKAVIVEPIINDLKLTITASGSTNICEGSSVILTASESTSYQWYKYGVAIANANSKTFIASTEGVFTVSKSNADGCQNIQSDGIDVKVIKRPVPPLVVANKLLFCEGDSVELNAISDSKISWYKDGIILSQSNVRQFVKAGGTYNAVAINENGCRSPFSESIVLSMIDLPVSPTLVMVGLPQFCKNESRLIKVNIPNGLKIKWYKNGSLLNNYNLDTLRVNEAAEFTAKFENSNNCLSLVSNRIVTSIVCNSTDIYIPDIFTPNGDGINDVIKPICVGISSFNYFKIYNRWGNILFESKDASIGWDGKFRGQIQPSDTYIWLVEGIDTNGKEIRKTGMFNLIK